MIGSVIFWLAVVITQPTTMFAESKMPSPRALEVEQPK